MRLLLAGIVVVLAFASCVSAVEVSAARRLVAERRALLLAGDPFDKIISAAGPIGTFVASAVMAVKDKADKEKISALRDHFLNILILADTVTGAQKIKAKKFKMDSGEAVTLLAEVPQLLEKIKAFTVAYKDVKAKLMPELTKFKIEDEVTASQCLKLEHAAAAGAGAAAAPAAEHHDAAATPPAAAEHHDGAAAAAPPPPAEDKKEGDAEGGEAKPAEHHDGGAAPPAPAHDAAAAPAAAEHHDAAAAAPAPAAAAHDDKAPLTLSSLFLLLVGLEGRLLHVLHEAHEKDAESFPDPTQCLIGFVPSPAVKLVTEHLKAGAGAADDGKKAALKVEKVPGNCPDYQDPKPACKTVHPSSKSLTVVQIARLNVMCKLADAKKKKAAAAAKTAAPKKTPAPAPRPAPAAAKKNAAPAKKAAGKKK